VSDIFKGGQYKPLSDIDVKKINESVLTILEKGGVQVNSKLALEYFESAGARIEESGKKVFISKNMVEDAIASAPSSVSLYGRKKEHDVVLEGSKVHFGTGGTAIYVLDLADGQRRYSTSKDICDLALLSDSLENVHVFTINVFPNEIKNKNDIDINRFYHSIINTSKHVMGGVYSMEGTKQVIDMATIIAGSEDKLKEKPFISFITLMISLLKIDDLYGDICCYVAKQGLPVVVPTEPLCGGTSPITLAANVAVHCAESLAGVVLTQLVNKGTPVIFGSVGSISDLATMGHVSGAVERGMINAAVSQMAQYYKLPLYSTAGTSDAKEADAQAGYESAISNLLVSMSGANFIHDAIGLMEFDLTVSYEKMVLDNEITGMCSRVLKGIEVNDETLAVDLICKAGPGGNFVSEMHTVEHMRKEFFQPEIADRKKRSVWNAEGSIDATARARQRAKHILKNHKPVSISQDVDTKIKDKFKNIKKITTIKT